VHHLERDNMEAWGDSQVESCVVLEVHRDNLLEGNCCLKVDENVRGRGLT